MSVTGTFRKLGLISAEEAKAPAAQSAGPAAPAAPSVPAASPAVEAVPDSTALPVLLDDKTLFHGPAELAGARAAPASGGSSAWLNVLGAPVHMVNSLIDSAAGYDEKILSQYGTPTDNKRRRNIGRAILVASAVGSLGWFAKILISFPTLAMLPVAIVAGVLYAVLSYSLESFFASNVNPFASSFSRWSSLFGRSLLSVVIALAGALPWITLTLNPLVKREMSRMALADQAQLRGSVDTMYGLAAIDRKAKELQAEASSWAAAQTTLPPAVQSALDEAQACGAAYDGLKAAADKRGPELSSRLALLAKLELARDITPARLKAVAVERAQIRTTQTKLAQDLSAKRGQCETLTASAQSARTAHLQLAQTEQMASQRRLAGLRQQESEVGVKVLAERAKVDQVIAETGDANAAAEFAALVKILTTQTYAQVMAAFIFLGLFLVDVLPLTLRLFARPGPYDAEKRTDDAIKMMRAEGRYMEAKMMHNLRAEAMKTESVTKIIRGETELHMRNIVMSGARAFLRKQDREQKQIDEQDARDAARTRPASLAA